MSSDTEIVGPEDQAALMAFAESPDPELPTEDRIRKMIGLLSVDTAHKFGSDAEAEAQMQGYWRILKDVPMVDLFAAYNDLSKRSTFLPKPAEIFQAAAIHTATRNWRKSRAKHIAWKSSLEWKPEAQTITAEEWQELRDSIKESGVDIA